MKKKQKRETHELESLVPSIKSAEQRLEELLAGARAEAADLIQAAEEAASRSIEEARAGLPALVAREREARMGALRAKAAEVLEAGHEDNRRLEKKASEGIGAAAALIVSRVWPGGAK